MYVRQKPNKSGLISVQIIDKSQGKYRVVKTVGSSADSEEVKRLVTEAKSQIPLIQRQPQLSFNNGFARQVFDSIEQIQLMGPELLLGRIFNEIGFNIIKDELFRHLVLTRLVYPVSKLKTTDYLYKYKGIIYDVDQLYRYLDKLDSRQKELVQQVSFIHTKKILGKILSVVFYDVTTLYFEIEQEDDLRKTGFSKDGKHQHPQIILGLLVSAGGYPLAYEIFEGNKFEGHTMLPVIEAFKAKYQLEKLIVVADAGLLSKNNIEELKSKDYEYILGARIKNESEQLKNQILSLKLNNGESVSLNKADGTTVIISYSKSRATKDEANRKKGLGKLEKALACDKLTKKNINNKGYNKYLKLDGEIKISIDYEKYKDDSKWDGLKGYITNTRFSKEEVITAYKQLWVIEKAFRISKTDLKIRPVYHRLRRRIEAHICIAFCAYKVYKELERQLKFKGSRLSPEAAIDILKTLFSITINIPNSNYKETMLIVKHDEQIQLLKLFNIDFGCPSA